MVIAPRSIAATFEYRSANGAGAVTGLSKVMVTMSLSQSR